VDTDVGRVDVGVQQTVGRLGTGAFEEGKALRVVTARCMRTMERRKQGKGLREAAESRGLMQGLARRRDSEAGETAPTV
jgi:hypothetical protein